jgi:hypothetical protein
MGAPARGPIKRARPAMIGLSILLIAGTTWALNQPVRRLLNAPIVEPPVLGSPPGPASAEPGQEPPTRNPLTRKPPQPPAPPAGTLATEPLAPALAQEPPRASNPVAKRDPAGNAKATEHGKRLKPHGRTTLDETAPTILPRLTEELINRQLRDADATMWSCYNSALAHGTLAKVHIRFDAQPDGTVTLTRRHVTGDNKNHDVARCVTAYVDSVVSTKLPRCLASTIIHRPYDSEMPALGPNGR